MARATYTPTDAQIIDAFYTPYRTAAYPETVRNLHKAITAKTGRRFTQTALRDAMERLTANGILIKSVPGDGQMHNRYDQQYAQTPHYFPAADKDGIKTRAIGI